jgi:hypothetical protein
MEQIRNANVSMFGVLKKVSKKELTETQALIEIGKELNRQSIYLQQMKKI